MSNFNLKYGIMWPWLFIARLQFHQRPMPKVKQLELNTFNGTLIPRLNSNLSTSCFCFVRWIKQKGEMTNIMLKLTWFYLHVFLFNLIQQIHTSLLDTLLISWMYMYSPPVWQLASSCSFSMRLRTWQGVDLVLIMSL